MEENYDKIMGIIANCYYYILSQFLPLLIVKKLPFVQYSGIELTKAVIYIQLVLFLIAATTIILINLKIKNPTKLELEVKEPKKYIIPWALLGFALVMIYQMVASIVLTQIYGGQQVSPNTEKLIIIARKYLYLSSLYLLSVLY